MSIYIRGVDLPSDEWLDIRVRADGPSEVATKEHPYWKEIEVVQVSGSPTGIDSISKHLLMEKLQKATTNSIDPMFAKGLLEAQRLVMNMPIGSNLSEFPTGSDLISRKHAILAVLDNGEITIGEYEEMIKPLKREICEWIPVSERLPEAPTFCLVTTDGSYNDVIDIALYMSDGWHKASKILAWMPLPAPYKGGEEE